MDERGGTVSQNAVERTLGKLLTDDEFCARFFANPAAATWEVGLPLSALELEALLGQFDVTDTELPGQYPVGA